MTANGTDHFRMTMSLRYLDNQLIQLRKYGYNRDQALSVLGLTDWDFKSPDARIDVRRVEKMYLDACQKLDDPFVGLRAGHDFRVPNFGKTGSMYAYCDNMAQVFDMNSKYQRLSVDVGRMRYAVEDDRHFFVYESHPEAHELHQVLGMIFGAYATAFRWLCWSTGRELKSVTLIRPEPEGSDFYRKVVNCPVTFGDTRNAVELFADTMAAELPTRNPEKLAHAISLLDGMLDKSFAAESFKSAVRASMRAAIGNGNVSLAVIADRLDMPERTLRRELKANGLSYRDLLDRERRALFRELHAHGNSFAEISQDLAYNDQAAFNRAFKRWYGIPPGEYKGED